MGLVQINGSNFTVPQDFDLVGSLDETAGTYRISLGIVEPTVEQLEQYTPLFAVISQQKRGLFIDSITFEQDNQRLVMILATVDVYVKPFGTFYEIESNVDDTKIITVKEKKNDTNRRTSSAKGKKINGKRKVTDKRNRGISRT